MRLVWVPEVPTSSIPLYRAKVPRAEGKLETHTLLVTADVAEALQFETAEECVAWCESNPMPPFVPAGHGLCD